MESLKINRSDFHEAFVGSARPHVINITNHGIHYWTLTPGLPDTGGQNVFVNYLTGALAKLGFKVTIINRGGYIHPATGEEREGLDYLDENRRIFFLEDSVREFVRKEDMHERLPELSENLLRFLEDDPSDDDLILSHYWDAGVLGCMLDGKLPQRLPHIWFPHTLG